MSKKISLNNINNFRKDFDSCSHCEISMNALTRSKLEDVSMDWESYRKIDHTFSDVIVPGVTTSMTFLLTIPFTCLGSSICSQIATLCPALISFGR